MRSFFNVDVNVGLRVKPIVVRLPFLVRVRKADVEGPYDLRDQFINFAQRDLFNTLVYVKVYILTSTYIFTKASASPSTELNHCFFHPHRIALNPTVRVEVVGILSKYILV
jgi:hypothetical protein